MRTITLQDVKDAASNLDLAEGITAEVCMMDGQILVAMYNRTIPNRPASASWKGDGYEAIRKLKDIQERYGKMQNV